MEPQCASSSGVSRPGFWDRQESHGRESENSILVSMWRGLKPDRHGEAYVLASPASPAADGISQHEQPKGIGQSQSRASHVRRSALLAANRGPGHGKILSPLPTQSARSARASGAPCSFWRYGPGKPCWDSAGASWGKFAFAGGVLTGLRLQAQLM